MTAFITRPVTRAVFLWNESGDISAIVSRNDTRTVFTASGPQGPAGALGASFDYTQGSASDDWIIAHNLGRYPSVTIVDSTGREVFGDVHYTDANNIEILFTSAFAGQAFLN